MSARIPRWAFGGPIDTVEDVAVNSFKDFHAKGLDYLCLHRSAELTRKLYIFRGDVSRAPEVVHRGRVARPPQVGGGAVRARYVYVLCSEVDPSQGSVHVEHAFTVKHELVTHLRRVGNVHTHQVVLRYDGSKGKWRTDPAKDYIE